MLTPKRLADLRRWATNREEDTIWIETSDLLALLDSIEQKEAIINAAEAYGAEMEDIAIRHGWQPPHMR